MYENHMFSHEDLVSFHETLQGSGLPDETLRKFQGVVAGIYREVWEQKQENEKLKQTLEK